MDPRTGSLTRGDRWSLIAFALTGLAIAGWFVIQTTGRIISLARGIDVPVAVDFIDTTTDIPFTDRSDSVAVRLDGGILTAPQLTPIATVPGILGQIVLALTVVTVIGCLLLLSRGILRGQMFSRRHTVLVSVAGIGGLIGFALARLFDNMLANATVSLMTDNRLDTAVLTVEPFTWVLAAFIVAVISTAFTIGDRLQREKATLQKDTEGLV
ncbi:hypothetical protein ACIQTT_13350 [Microbacterium sp. NPDC090225]|uniref:hypothetical protein n=1 Tax=Microbacterium sp. NPDC090225 TaxID=3364207 RepID=UPI00380BD39E